ncbi:MAG: response regulator transcription factor [Leptospiraceae bacterium]|nr:response regulator transcription factor [Leptospiraceae bacterium]
MEKIKILILDDHEVFLDGMKFALTEKEDFVVDTVLTESMFMEYLGRQDYQIFILDFMIPGTNTLDLISNIRIQKPKSKIIVLSSLKEKKLFTTLKEKNVNGYIFKSEAKQVIKDAIQKILKGEEFYSQLGDLELERFESSTDPFETLTEKELEIVRNIAKGLRNKQIAEELKISSRTVEAHKRNIDMKLGRIPKAQLKNLALKWKLVG